MFALEATETLELRAGDVFGEKYLLLEPIALGGMGRVWRARNMSTGAEVAAKFLLPDHATSVEGLIRFRREARATAALFHRAIVRVFDLVEIDPERGSLVMILELLRGHSLAAHIEQMGPMSVDETLTLAMPLLSALTHAHGLGIVHRDLKPDNVFLAIDPDGRTMPRIVDFGVSKLAREAPITAQGAVIGTLSYMSPEQSSGGAVDARSDIFAMGVLLYECLSGRNPYGDSLRGNQMPANLMSLFDAEPVRPLTIPEPLWNVILRTLSYNPADRFATAAELGEALRRAAPALRGSPDSFAPTAREMAPTVRVESAVRPRRPGPTLRIAGAALVVACAVVGWRLGHEYPAAGFGRSRTAGATALHHTKRLVPATDSVRSAVDSDPVPDPSIAAKGHAPAVKRPVAPAAAPPVADEPAAPTPPAPQPAPPQGVVRDPGF